MSQNYLQRPGKGQGKSDPHALILLKSLTQSRVRGYQFKSEGPGESKKNPPAFRNLNDAQERLAEALPPTPSADAQDLEAQGFAERTL